MNATAAPDAIVATSTHSRIDWSEPTANPNVEEGTPITVLRTLEGKWVAVEGLETDDIAHPTTLVQHMKSMDLRRHCVVWATWDGVKKAGFWDSMPDRMPLYKIAA